MTQNNNTSSSQQQVSSEALSKTIGALKDDIKFEYPKTVIDAISIIVIAVHNSYERTDNSINYLSETVVKTLQERPVADQYMQITRKDLAQKPLIFQMLILMQDIVRRQRLDHSSRLIWLAIALHSAALLIVSGRKTDTKNILMQFKMAQFSSTPRRVWLWQALSDIEHIDMSFECTLSVFNNLLEQHQNALTAINNNQATHTDEVNKDKSDLKAKLSQIEKIKTAYQNAHILQKPRPKHKKPPKHIKIKTINLVDDTSVLSLDSAQTSHNWNSTNRQDTWGSARDDIEHDTTAINPTYLEANTETYEGLTTSLEERLDHLEAPYVSYREYLDPFIKNSIPLQTVDLSLQQNYMSQRDLALNSNTRLLSLTSYQALFAALNQDASTLIESETHKTCASILLLSMITGLPMKSLLIPGYIGHPSIFSLNDKRYYIKHSLGITKRSNSQTLAEEDYENHSDTIKTPLPLWLIDNLLDCKLPVKKNFTAYLADLRSSLGLPYLSINRIETALHVVLSRYTPDCHKHIADIICRTPASHAPAMYYSSHTSAALIAHYKSALSVFSSASIFDLAYLTPWHKYTVGSGFALKIQVVHTIINEIKREVDVSKNEADHFNKISIFVWFIFCLLTGVRPNNGLGKTYDIDLEMGWLLINDKPVKKVKSDRLIPLCTTLIRHLTDYRAYLIDYQAKHQAHHDISAIIDDIRLGNDEALLKLLSERISTFNDPTLKNIKRGDAYHMTKHIVDANPYWTRHFVRTQLEKRAVALDLINTVIGHEKPRQEVLGRFSSSSKADIKSVASVFEQIAEQLGITDIKIGMYSKVNDIEISCVKGNYVNR